MTDLAATDTLFFERAGLDKARVESIVDEALNGADERGDVPGIPPVREPCLRR